MAEQDPDHPVSFWKGEKIGIQDRTDHLDKSLCYRQPGGCGCRNRGVQKQGRKCHEEVQEIKAIPPRRRSEALRIKPDYGKAES